MIPSTIPSLDQLRRDAKRLRRAYEAGEPHGLQRLRAHPPRKTGALRHADFLHVIARERGFESWPRLTWAAETVGLDRAARQRQLAKALSQGVHWKATALLAETPDLAHDQFGLCCATYDLGGVTRMLADDPAHATRASDGRAPIAHLAFSRYLHCRPELETAMLTIAGLLLDNGADVNDGISAGEGSDHRLSVLYGAIGHANNMPLGRWLLGHGADPNDGESLYHATELGHHEGLRLLLDHGANPRGTNALLRAMDFHDHEAVCLLLDHGARADDFDDAQVGSEPPWTAPALFQAARRGSDRAMVDLLLQAGARVDRRYQGASIYPYARVYGSAAVAEAVAGHGADTAMTREETVLAGAADGLVATGEYLDPALLPDAYRNIIRTILHLPGRLDHLRRLVALGVEFDRPDDMGVTPVQIAGWEGLPEVMAYFLSLSPDLGHVNGYGGTLLGTILHGASNNPDRATRDHIACVDLALTHGVALPRTTINGTERQDLAEFLQDWADRHPGQVV